MGNRRSHLKIKSFSHYPLAVSNRSEYAAQVTFIHPTAPAKAHSRAATDFIPLPPRLLSLLSALLSITLLPAAVGAELSFDFSQASGSVRPLHGGNNGPLGQGETVDLSKFHRELAIPFTRLHDSAWPYPDIVDVHAIFPNFNADPDNPRSYRFGPTDDYLRAITNVGSRIVYRLGESIEHAKRKRYVHPPADPQKWARICLGIIRHYNEGWADGHRFGIDYWEIWNEPENQPAMWTGTAQQYYELYAVTANAIRSRWPKLKVGGPSLGHQGVARQGRLEPSDFLRGFIGHVRQSGAPLDFFSWHGYTDDPDFFARQAIAIRAFLDREGFSRTESHLNEWNYLPDRDWRPMLSAQGEQRERWYARQGGVEGAAFVTATLISLQDAPVDVANFYSADNQPFGLFSLHGAPKKTFEAFRLFRTLLATPSRAADLATASPGVWRLAGVGAKGDRAAVLIARSAQASQAGSGRLTIAVSNLPWAGPTRVEHHQLDPSGEVRVRQLTWKTTAGALELEPQAPAIDLLTFVAETATAAPSSRTFKQP